MVSATTPQFSTMSASRRACLVLALVAAACLAACFDGGGPIAGWDGGSDCQSNNPPAIGNVEMNSLEIEEEERGGDDDDSADVRWYLMSIHFDWVDPGAEGAEDPPNLVAGGYFSGEIFGYDLPDFEFTRANLVDACAAPGVEGNPDPCAAFGHGSTGCPSEETIDQCTQGEFTLPLEAEGGGFPGDVVLDVEFRIRDACGATSNEKAASYQPGTGMAVETE